MTAIKEVKSGKNQGKAKNGNKAKGSEGAKVATLDKRVSENTDPNVIFAEREGTTRSFVKKLWDALPPAKEGWKEVTSGKPAPLQTTGDESDSDAANKMIVARELFKKTFKAEAGDDMTIEQINSALEADKENVDHVVTQEDLDLNAELASSGAKVGDTIRVPKNSEE